MSAPSEPVIEIRDLSHWYGEGDARRQVLFDIDLTIRAGEVVFLMGPSGCGKTTLLTLVGALRSVQEGSLKLLGRELNGAAPRQMVELRRRIGFVFQNQNLHRSLTALGNVRMGLEVQGLSGRTDADARCRDLLGRVGIADHATKRQDKLSGGQRQRVAVARALVGGPSIILADEPTAALDKRTGRDVVQLMATLARERGTTVLMVTHDNRIFDFADRIIEMEDGRMLPAAETGGSPGHALQFHGGAARA